MLLGHDHSQGSIVSKNPSNKLEFLDSSTREPGQDGSKKKLQDGGFGLSVSTSRQRGNFAGSFKIGGNIQVHRLGNSRDKHSPPRMSALGH